MTTRKHYSREFKENAVKLSYQRSNISDLARELGIRSNLLYRWREESQTKGKESFPGNGKQSVTPEYEELLELRRQLKRKEMELEILKKAVSIISKNDC
jgi:transposase